MLKLVLNRILISIPLLFLVTAISFLIQSLLPGDMANVIGGLDATPEDLEAIRIQLGLDQPVYMQYLNWLANLLQGNLGVSLANGESVSSVLATRLPVTLSLVIGATVLSLVLGVLLGILSSWGPKKLGKVIDVLSILGLAAPSFWIALVLVSIFSVSLGLLPPEATFQSLNQWVTGLYSSFFRLWPSVFTGSPASQNKLARPC